MSIIEIIKRNQLLKYLIYCSSPDKFFRLYEKTTLLKDEIYDSHNFFIFVIGKLSTSS